MNKTNKGKNKIFNIFLFKNPNKIHKKISFLNYFKINLFILAIFGILFFFYYQSKKTKDFPIEKLILQTPIHPSSYISSFFFLKKIQFLIASSQKCNLYLNDLYLKNQLQQQLLENNIFNSLKITASKNNKAIIIQYCLRTPIAYLGNLSNTFIDKYGKTFPATPFFLPQNLPTVFSSSFNSEKKCIDEREISLIKKILTHELPIKVIDFSKLPDASSEIILSLINQDIIRLATDNFEETLHYYQFLKKNLYKNLENQKMIFDLRIKGLAFTQKIN